MQLEAEYMAELRTNTMSNVKKIQMLCSCFASPTDMRQGKHPLPAYVDALGAAASFRSLNAIAIDRAGTLYETLLEQAERRLEFMGTGLVATLD